MGDGKIVMQIGWLVNFTGNSVLPEIPVRVSPGSSLSVWDSTEP
jgi:hypothetical protein